MLNIIGNIVLMSSKAIVLGIMLETGMRRLLINESMRKLRSIHDVF